MMLAGKVSHTKRTCWSRKSSHNTGLECDERCELVADWTVTESCSPPTTFISQSVSSPVTLTPPVSTLTVLQDLSQPATMTENEFKRWPICAFPSSVHLTIKTVEWMGCTVDCGTVLIWLWSLQTLQAMTNQLLCKCCIYPNLLIKLQII